MANRKKKMAEEITINEIIPVELLLEIFSCLDAASLSEASLTCKHWKHLCQSEILWKTKSLESSDTDAKKYILDSKSKGNSWKESFQLNYRNNLIRSKWKQGMFSQPKDPLQLPDKLMCPMTAETWGEIFEMELER